MNKKKKVTLIVMIILYAATLVTCFICDLALSGSLTWFYMVFVSILILFSITTLPLIVQKHKSLVSALAVTVFTYVLLYVCCVYVSGDWLISFAYPIATYSFLFAWVLFFIFRSRKMNWAFKTSLALLLIGIFTITCNPLVLVLSGDTFHVMDLFKYDGGAVNYSANGIIFICLLAGAGISAVIGLFSLKRK